MIWSFTLTVNMVNY